MFYEDTLFMLSGLPGCGKSTLRTKLVQNMRINPYMTINPWKLSRDDIVDTIADAHHFTYSEAWRLAPKLIDAIMARNIKNVNGQASIPVIWDQTHLTESSRKRNMNKLPNYTTRVCIQIEKVPYYSVADRLKSRDGKEISEELYNQMYGQYMPAMLHEGFQEIWTFDILGKLVDAQICGKTQELDDLRHAIISI